ncbi:MAG: FIG01121542: hypothetical protein [uncultured Chloroflexia bacterium]|uniref:Uncharacterized protein n=1 Tax=uncultured Chloroflexia bacterium TaxID=1672391 RepID=A0A6J4N5Z2_9CHLR|nr:MAG: FIG01121542: hypothetical protein [uncultured Chloroflexia bacterium]
MSIHVFGIRHHGPGCGRSLVAALGALEPDVVLIEGPPDAHAVLPLLMHERMQPPVALLIYAPDEPQRAAFYPFTSFSPEWQALRWAFEHDVPARFIDLPQANSLAAEVHPSQDLPATEEIAATSDETTAPPVDEPEAEATARLLHDDPIGMLAEAAGYTDHELWWEHQIEQRLDSTELFMGIMEAMTVLRSTAEPASGREAQREAYMRQQIRAAQREGFERIAVVCGAWHAPLLADPGPPKEDAALLAALPRIKVAATWIPWTNGRLAYRSGYGAGVASPGWYAHLWTTPDHTSIRWLARAAALLRAEGLLASSSNVIEAVRLADALAALRGLPMPGLVELTESIQTVLCGGEPAPMQLIRDRLEIGEALGEVPPETPMVPLQTDLEMHQRRLRLKPSVEITQLDLDLRNDNDRARSQLLHKLRLLAIPWGQPLEVSGKQGTFHEFWTLQWQPEFALSVIEACVWGNTLDSAADARVRARANDSDDLAELSALLDVAILAALTGSIDHLLVRVRDQAALGADVRRLMDALPPLARVARYGDIRETRAEQVLPVIDALFERAVVGLPGACSSLDDEAAATMTASIMRAQESVTLLGDVERRGRWQGALRGIVDRETIHGLVRGFNCRLLLEHDTLDSDDLERIARLALSPVVPREQAAAWIEGLLRGSAILLMHHEVLGAALVGWLHGLDEETFTAMLPLVRRAFARFESPERRAMGEKIKRLHTGDAAPSALTQTGDSRLQPERAALVIPVLRMIIGASDVQSG